MATLLPLSISAEGFVSREYRIKVGLIYNLIQFIEFPDETTDNNTRPFVIGIAGKDPFGKEMAVIDGKIVNNRKLEIRYFPEGQNLANCQVLFINVTEKEQLESILDNVEKASVLTISDIEGFAHSGGMINFIKINNKIRFEVNLEKARQAGLKISSHFLKLASIID